MGWLRLGGKDAVLLLRRLLLVDLLLWLRLLLLRLHLVMMLVHVVDGRLWGTATAIAHRSHRSCSLLLLVNDLLLIGCHSRILLLEGHGIRCLQRGGCSIKLLLLLRLLLLIT